MKLYITPASPYARMARIVVIEKGLQNRVEIILAQTRLTDSPYYKINPSGRVPYLIRDDGIGMEESALICAYLDQLDGKPSFNFPTADHELDADSFDAVICRIALMLFPNPVKALTDMRRVVKPGGKVTVMVYAALEKNPFWEIFHRTVRRLGNIPPPAPDEPWMFALGEPGALEDVYRRGDFPNVSVRAVLIQRRSPSAVAAVGNMRKSASDAREIMNRLNEADRERAWADITEEFRRYEGPNGFEIPGEVRIGVGAK